VVDKLIDGITRVVQGHAPGLVAAGVMVAEMALDVFIPSVSGKAAISMPILSFRLTNAAISVSPNFVCSLILTMFDRKHASDYLELLVHFYCSRVNRAAPLNRTWGRSTPPTISRLKVPLPL